jgi:PhzF family phenazine biosynthesis protein
MGIPIYQVDAFTDQPFRGNPAAVCVLDKLHPEAGDAIWMQDVAREMNLSETAFVHKQGDGFALRWFTPAVEVELCGHATLASAHILYETGLLPSNEQARFHTLSGLLTAERSGREIVLVFPATPPEATSAPPGLIEALGVEPRYVGASRFDYLIEVASEDAVRGLKLDFAALKALAARGNATRGVMVTSVASTAGYDFVSRFFAPGAGIDEDPVTGSAHCCLGPFWRDRLGKDEMLAYQASARGGVVRVRIEGERVRLTGRAVTVLRGELVCP